MNNENIHKIQEPIGQYIATDVYKTVFNVVRATRHEMRVIIDDCHIQLLLMSRLLQNPQEENITKIQNKIHDISEHLFRMGMALDRIKAVTKPLIMELQKVSINMLWEEAFNMIIGKLTQYNIQYHIEGREVKAEIYPDFIRHAFLQLIMNSIDAFIEKKQRETKKSVYLYNHEIIQRIA